MDWSVGSSWNGGGWFRNGHSESFMRETYSWTGLVRLGDAEGRVLRTWSLGRRKQPGSCTQSASALDCDPPTPPPHHLSNDLANRGEPTVRNPGAC
eukprot:2019145-Rhodomonas_salina.1